MEQIAIKLDDKEAFDRNLQNSLPDGGDLKIITKDNATVGGNPAVMLIFSVRLPDGSLRKAQTVTTMKLLRTVLRALDGKYSDFDL